MKTPIYLHIFISHLKNMYIYIYIVAKKVPYILLFMYIKSNYIFNWPVQKQCAISIILVKHY